MNLSVASVLGQLLLPSAIRTAVETVTVLNGARQETRGCPATNGVEQSSWHDFSAILTIPWSDFNCASRRRPSPKSLSGSPGPGCAVEAPTTHGLTACRCGTGWLRP